MISQQCVWGTEMTLVYEHFVCGNFSRISVLRILFLEQTIYFYSCYLFSVYAVFPNNSPMQLMGEENNL